MKYCSQCQQTYTDDSLNFCLSDGTALTLLSDPAEETVVISSPVALHGQQFAKPGVNPVFAYLSIGLIALLAGGGLVWWLKSDGTASSTANNQPVTPASLSNGPLTAGSNSQSNAPRPDPQIPPQEKRSPDVQKNTSLPPAPRLSRPSNGTWFIVLGSYPRNESAKADQRLRYIHGLGYDASIVDTDNYPGFRGGYYSVVIGPYSKADAKGLLGRMKSSVGDAYIKSGW